MRGEPKVGKQLESIYLEITSVQLKTVILTKIRCLPTQILKLSCLILFTYFWENQFHMLSTYFWLILYVGLLLGGCLRRDFKLTLQSLWITFKFFVTTWNFCLSVPILTIECEKWRNCFYVNVCQLLLQIFSIDLSLFGVVLAHCTCAFVSKSNCQFNNKHNAYIPAWHSWLL